MLPKFDYFAPESLQETFSLLDKYGKDARPLAGGTDLLVSLRGGQEPAKYLIDIKKVKELQNLSFNDKSGLTVGAGVTLNRLIRHDAVSKNYPILREAASTIGDFQVRNRATLVGNICNASPAADTAPALLVLNATVNISTQDGTKKVPIHQFFTGVKKNILAGNELVTSIDLPIPPEKSISAYMKARRTMGEDLAVVGVGGLAAPTGGSGKEIRLAYASVAPTPVRAFEAEKIFRKDRPVDELVDEAIPVVMKAVSPITDVRAGKEYRVNLVKVLTRRLVKQLWEAS
ncbi:MAG: xanthine dehydrogenase family protein subunit M [Candidatus Bathyarchaeia archaeon]